MLNSKSNFQTEILTVIFKDIDEVGAVVVQLGKHK